MSVTGASIRYAVTPRDVPAPKAARRLHLTLAEFEEVKEELFRRGFPRPDPTTGMFDLHKVDEWMDARQLTGCTEDRNGVLDPREIMRKHGWGPDHG
jgi:hypothetical protein